MDLSKLFTLNLADVGKAVLMAFFGAILSAVWVGIQAGQFPTTWPQWQTILIFAVGSAGTYLVKNFLTNSNGVPLLPDPKQLPAQDGKGNPAK